MTVRENYNVPLTSTSRHWKYKINGTSYSIQCSYVVALGPQEINLLWFNYLSNTVYPHIKFHSAQQHRAMTEWIKALVSEINKKENYIMGSIPISSSTKVGLWAKLNERNNPSVDLRWRGRCASFLLHLMRRSRVPILPQTRFLLTHASTPHPPPVPTKHLIFQLQFIILTSIFEQSCKLILVFEFTILNMSACPSIGSCYGRKLDRATNSQNYSFT